MKIFIKDQGDNEVGIHPAEAVIDINIEVNSDTREHLREQIKEFFECQFGFEKPMEVRFDDECVECLQKLSNNDCENKECIRNWRHEHELV